MIKNTLSSILLAVMLCCGLTTWGQTSTEGTGPAPTDTVMRGNYRDCSDAFDCPDDYINYRIGTVLNAGNSELAPYYIASDNCLGGITQQYSALVMAGAAKMWSKYRRFSWYAGLDIWGGYTSSAGYERYKGNGQFEVQKQHPARAWIHQAYLGAKYRSIFATAGQKFKESPIVNGELSSGDLVWSMNARPPVGLRAGFIDFQDIPFTKGWVQLNGEFGYFRQFDDKWLENHYNYYNHFITTGTWLHYII